MKEVLLPVLKNIVIVILDNLSSHKDESTMEHSYSPHLNPLEKIWRKIKSILGEMATETPTLLFEAIRAAFAHITSENANGWFRSCRYFQF